MNFHRSPLALRSFLFTVAAAAIATTGSHLSAQNAENQPLVTAAFTSMEKALRGIRSMDFQVTSQATENDAIYRDTHPTALLTGGRTAEISLKTAGRKYWYSETLTEADGSGVRSHEYAYDGQTYQVFTSSNQSLLTSKYDREHTHFDLGLFNPLEMFGFLMSQIPGDGYTISPTLFENPLVWQRCLAGAKYLHTTDFSGKPCVVAKIPGGILRFLNVPCDYIVFFSAKDDLFPIAWRAIDRNGRLLMDYQVDEFGKIPVEGATFYFPKRATLHEYTSTKFPANVAQMTVTIETSQFLLNTISSDATFTIDSHRANEIIDADTNTARLVHR